MWGVDMSILVPVDPSALIFRTLIETFAGILMLYLVFTQRKWATVFLELSIVFAVIDRTFIFIGRDPTIFFTHDLLTTLSSLMVLCTVIARVFETDNIAKKCEDILKKAVDTLIQENEEESSNEVDRQKRTLVGDSHG